MMRIPSATYRLQLHAEFGFKDAQAILPYLAELGITDLYASPILTARIGSRHGYDTVDPDRLNPELGGEAAASLRQDLVQYGMGWLQDIVPNHMAFDGANPILMELFETGSASPYAAFFDIDWDHPDPELNGRLLAPFLGEPLSEVLRKGDLRLVYTDGALRFQYHALHYPLLFRSYAEVLRAVRQERVRTLGERDPAVDRLDRLLTTHEKTPPGPEERRTWKADFNALCRDDTDLHRGLEAVLETSFRSGNGGNPPQPLIDLLNGQVYHLAFWKEANRAINYRRFFTINELISVRVELPEVFDHVHRLIFQGCRDGWITGLRVDHVDGLYDPTGYLRRLRAAIGDRYLVVEKILERDEALPPSWPVQGTTGYDFLNVLNGLFCRENHREAFEAFYVGFTGMRNSPGELLYINKKRVLRDYMNGDLDNLTRLFARLLRGGGTDPARPNGKWKEALTEAIACFPVYRTYPGEEGMPSEEAAFLRDAVAQAQTRRPDLTEPLRRLQEVLSLAGETGRTEADRASRLHFCRRFQQLTSPLMAKGFEDTTLYIYNRLASLNEVGGDPARFGTPMEQWHGYLLSRKERWPHAMNCTATHDTKRGEDMRARINVLSEIPKEWFAKVKRWHRLNAGRKIKVGRRRLPDKNDEYLIYQTLVGAYPFREVEREGFTERVQHYMIKAAREAKVHTDWVAVDADYEKALADFIAGILEPSADNGFSADFLPFQKKVAHYGVFNSLSQTLLKLTTPGVPDFYQGSELWDFSLVDPDNRRPVDYTQRTSGLEQIRRRMAEDRFMLLEEILRQKEDGRLKLFVVHAVLQARRSNAALFQQGDYLPMKADGPHAEHLIVHARRWEERWAVAVTPRWLTGLTAEGESPLGRSVWGETCIRLPEQAPRLWREVFSDRTVEGNDLCVGDLLDRFPAALLLTRA